MDFEAPQRSYTLRFLDQRYPEDPHTENDDDNCLCLGSVQISPFQDLKHIRNPSSRFTGSEECLQQICDWILECDQNHGRCSYFESLSSPRELPTRLLRIHEDGVKRTLKLVDNTELTTDTLYTTLSYRWGGDASCTLRQGNVEEFRRGVLIDKLPQTFQDAVSVTSRLGLHHIWIDALCIIQDSQPDWMLEGSRMCTVFTGSYLTISAAASADASGGLFRSRPFAPNVAFKVIAKWQGITPGDFYCHEQFSWARKVSHGHLAKRGWIYQERLLSQRMVSFTTDQIVWECAEIVATESLIHGINEASLHYTDHLKSWLVPSTIRDLQETEEERQHALSRQWNLIAQGYSECDLTVKTDKMMAIAGIAERHKLISNRP